MIDTYVKSSDPNALAAFLADFRNIIPPGPGRAAVAEDDTQTPPVAAQPALGVPGYFYACIRTTAASVVPDGTTILACDPVEGAAVVGGFA